MKILVKIQIFTILLFFVTPSFSSNTILWSEDKNTIIKIVDINLKDNNKNAHPAIVKELDILHFYPALKQVKDKKKLKIYLHKNRKTNSPKI